MTERATLTLPFSSLGPRRVEADFSAGHITTDAGALLLREADRRLGLIDAFDRAIPDPRAPDLISRAQRSMLAQRVLGLALDVVDGAGPEGMAEVVVEEFGDAAEGTVAGEDEPQDEAAQPGFGDGEPEERLRGLGGREEGRVEGVVGAMDLPVDELPADEVVLGEAGDRDAGEGIEGDAEALPGRQQGGGADGGRSARMDMPGVPMGSGREQPRPMESLAIQLRSVTRI